MSNGYNSLLTADIRRAINGKALDVEGNRALCAAALAGDGTARQRLIEGNMPMVVSIVDSLIGCSPSLAYLRDDMTSAGFLALAETITKRIQRVAQVAATMRYLEVAIRRAVRRLIAHEVTIYVPPRSQQAARAQGDPIEPPCVINRLPERPRLSNDACGDTDARDFLESCCTREEERTFIAMRGLGHSHAQIAAAIGMTPSAVSKIKTKLEDHVVETLKALCNE